jgi:hypothetical protein
LKEKQMRTLLAGLALSTIVLGAPEPAAAQDYPWCAHYGKDGSRNCGFVTYQQCLATISGIGGFCAENPFYFASHPAAQPRKRKKRVDQ